MERADEGSLARRTVAAARWRVAASVLQGAFQLAVGVMLARTLPPSDFGLVALAYVVVGLALLFSEAGLGAALVRVRPLTEAHVRTTFTASLLLGLAAAALLWVAAPAAAGLLRQDELAGVLRALAPLFVLGGAGATARALLQRELEFRALFAVELASYVAGYAPVALFLAVSGYGVRALVWGMLAQTGVGTAVALVLRRHSFRPLLSRGALREMAGFGGGTSLVRLSNFAAGHFDNLVVGRWLGPAALGLYGRAYNVVNLPLAYLSDPAWYVLYPALSELRGQPERVRRAYLAAVRVSALTAAPVLAGMAVAAPHMVPALYGAGWGGAVLPLQLLCAAALFRSMYRVSGALAHASGRVYGEAARQAVFAALTVAGAGVGTRWGVGGVGAGVAFAGLAMYAMMSRLSLQVLGCGWRPFVAAQLPGAAVGALVGAVALAVRGAAERAGFGHGAAFLAILAACAAVAPVALVFLPPGVLPERISARLRLPAAIRGAATRLASVFA